jgi:hypothetical protein
MLLNVAIPPTAATVNVPPSVDPPGFAAIVSVMLPTNDGASALPASRACTTIDGETLAPATVFAGCTVNLTCVAALLVPVALIVSGEPASPALVALIDCGPTVAPSVHVVCT